MPRMPYVRQGTCSAQSSGLSTSSAKACRYSTKHARNKFIRLLTGEPACTAEVLERVLLRTQMCQSAASLAKQANCS